jgi:hypothetical protein
VSTPYRAARPRLIIIALVVETLVARKSPPTAGALLSQILLPTPPGDLYQPAGKFRRNGREPAISKLHERCLKCRLGYVLGRLGIREHPAAPLQDCAAMPVGDCAKRLGESFAVTASRNCPVHQLAISALLLIHSTPSLSYRGHRQQNLDADCGKTPTAPT